MPGSELRLLALDGGGMCGLSALMSPQAADPDASPKSYEFFDMIGGTSAGHPFAELIKATEDTWQGQYS
jgi:patatin-like phospholipase/acyl hydrolase